MIKRSDIVNIWKKNFSLTEVELLEKYLKNRLVAMPLHKVQYMIAHKNLFGLFLVFFNTARECPELLGRTIWHSISFTISFTSRIILNKLK
jgi:type IV secretory pathway VirB3-like protein